MIVRVQWYRRVSDDNKEFSRAAGFWYRSGFEPGNIPTRELEQICDVADDKFRHGSRTELYFRGASIAEGDLVRISHERIEDEVYGQFVRTGGEWVKLNKQVTLKGAVYA